MRFLIALLLTAVSFLSAQAPDPRWPMFKKHLLDEGANESAAVADVNQDGKPDVISGENWFEAPSWIKHRFREIAVTRGYVDDFSNFALDVEGDGDLDVIACSWFSRKIAWYENPGVPHSASAGFWKEHVIETGFNNELMLLVDVDGDGKAEELLPNYGSSGEVAWFERARPVAQGKWTRHSVGFVPDMKGQHGVGAGDVNRDGRPDILTPRGWFEGPVNVRSDNWKFHQDFELLSPRRQCSPLFTYDVNGDGKQDLIFGAAHQYGLFWLENKGRVLDAHGKGYFQWEQHLVDDSWSQAHALALADLDNDGRLDIVTGKRYLAHDIDPGAYEPLGLYWYRLLASGQYVKHVLDFGTKVGGGMQIPVLDIDGDGDKDVIVAGKSGLYLFEQVDFPRQKSN